MSLAAYLQRNNVERILLCEIEQGDLCFYISDGIYRTEDADSIGALPFEPLIGRGGLPSYRTSLADILAPRASVSTGSLNLTDEMAMSTDSGGSPQKRSLLDNLKRGATMTFKITGPRGEFAYSEAITLFTTKVRSIGGDDTGGLTVETTSDARRLFEAYTPTERGVYGRVSNIPLQLVDYANQYYDTHPGGPIQAVSAVYDEAVALVLTTGYTVNLTNGQVTLVNNPAGLVTGDIDGFKDGSTWLESIEDIACYLAEDYVSCGTFDTPTDRIGYFHNERQRLVDVFDALARSAAAFWFLDDTGDLRFKLWDVPGTASESYTQKEMLNYKFSMNDAIYDSQEIRYNRNWTVQQALSGATAAHADYVATPGPTTTQTDAGDGSDAVDAPLIESYFKAQTPADTVATRVTDLMASKRRRFTVPVPVGTTHELGDSVEFETNEGDVTGVVMGIEPRFDGGAPFQWLELYA